MSVLPTVNLISNIGFGADATHTLGQSKQANREKHHMNFPLAHPIEVSKNIRADQFTYDEYLRASLPKRIYNKLIDWLR